MNAALPPEPASEYPAQPNAVARAGDPLGEYLEPDTLIAVGVGHATVSRDGETVYQAPWFELESGMTVREAESLARRQPGCDWRIHLVGLLGERHYRRTRDGRWALYGRGYGLS